MKINKLVCDQCKNEYDLTQMHFGGQNTWQEITEWGEHSEVINKDFCSIKCVIEYYKEKL